MGHTRAINLFPLLVQVTMSMIFEGPPLTYQPPSNLTLPQLMLDVTHPLRPVRFTNNPWLIDDRTGLEYNFEETRTRVYGLANELAARYNVGHGDVVCTFTPNDIGTYSPVILYPY